MPWFRVDDQSPFHPKVLRVGNGAYGAWVRMGAYCAGQLSNGVVPAQVAHMIATKRELQTLIDANMLHIHVDGYEMHDYLDYQRSKEQVQQEREATKDRVKKHRERQGNGATAVVSNTVTPTVTNAFVPDRMGSGDSSGSASEGKSPEKGRRFRLAGQWSNAGLPGNPDTSPLDERFESLPPEQIPATDENWKAVKAIVAYRDAMLEHKAIKIPMSPLRLAEDKHFLNIVEVMLGKFDLSKLADRRTGDRDGKPQNTPTPRPPRIEDLRKTWKDPA